MLNLLIGPSGSGKTRYILDRLSALAAEGQQNILWLVPEQYSFESERALLRALGPVGASHVRVTSFSRLADLVSREVGGLAGRRLDEGTRALLMSRALTQVAAVAEDTATPIRGLRVRLSTDSAYVEQLLSLWEELRQCAVPTAELERVAAELASDEGLLSDQVEALYRDMGQVANAKGNRSLYYDEYAGTGKYWKESDTFSRVEYTYLREDGGTTTLTYRFKGDQVTSISMVISGGEL